ncbi:MAG: hypothetical protein M0012_01310 [Deltaproteobacteria bacterium]|nr:hypothetical protein [Deltaproteobacteria bacterium]
MRQRKSKTKIRKIVNVYIGEILFLQKSGMSLRQISKELYVRHRIKISYNYLSEILAEKG